MVTVEMTAPVMSAGLASGIMTFQVNQKGMVYEKDLGEDTATAAPAIDAYNPGEGWRAAVD